MTNRDRIEKMTNKDLVKYLSLANRCPPDWENIPCPDYMECEDCWVKWLNTEMNDQ